MKNVEIKIRLNDKIHTNYSPYQSEKKREMNKQINKKKQIRLNKID